MIAIRDGGLCCGCGPVACTTCTPCPTVAAWELTGSLLPTGCFNPSGFDRTVEIPNPYDGLIYGFGLVHQLQQLVTNGTYTPAYINGAPVAGEALACTYLGDWKLTITTTPLYRIEEGVQVPLAGATAGVISKTGMYPASPGVDTEPGNCGPWNVGDLKQQITALIVPKSGTTESHTITIHLSDVLNTSSHPALPAAASAATINTGSPYEYQVTLTNSDIMVGGSQNINIRTSIAVGVNSITETVTHIFKDGAWTAAGFTATSFPWDGTEFGFDLTVPGLFPGLPPSVKFDESNDTSVFTGGEDYQIYAWLTIDGNQIIFEAIHYDAEWNETFASVTLPLVNGPGLVSFTVPGGPVELAFTATIHPPTSGVLSQRILANFSTPENPFAKIGCTPALPAQPISACFRKHTYRSVSLNWGVSTQIKFQDPYNDFKELTPPGQVSPYAGGITTAENGSIGVSSHHACAPDYSSVTSTMTFSNPPDNSTHRYEWMDLSPYAVTQSVGARRTWGGTINHPAGDPNKADRWLKEIRKSDNQITAYLAWRFDWKPTFSAQDNYYPTNTARGFEIEGKIFVERVWVDGYTTADFTVLKLTNEILSGPNGIPGQHTLASLLGTHSTPSGVEVTIA